ncbi:uncharacterized protein LOC111580300 [Amphiprion ocellaris]|uniref:uncharacterized protein LOC111580300 n=1 Tax=Amphiprion ocellaris TaxID=80972 RepID=UPI002410E0E7|nr:uncharacterized protein LOC111580300 [Amphiprion ocellaris]
MWPSMWPGWLCVLSAALSAGSVLAETTVYGKVGGEVDLRPDARSVTNTIKSVLWKAGPDIAMEWEGMEIVSHRHFKGRCYLNTSTGVMTITQLTPNDSGVYTPEINDVLSTPINLIIISAVPVPTVLTSCDEEMTRCTLTCDGQTTEAEEVTYRWKSDDTIVMDAIKKEYVIVKENSSGIKKFSCDLENVVSSESSQPISNPFNTAPEEPLKVSTGLTVFISLLAAVLLLGIFHRLKAGMWFYEKASMPWEADFWRKQERPARDAAVSNGTTAHGEKEQSDEETAMT